MGVSFTFFVVNTDKKDEYDNMIKARIEDYNLQDWLEQNTIIKDANFCLSCSSMSDLTVWLENNSKSSYSPDADVFYEIDKSDSTKENFLNLYWIKENWLKPHNIWCDNTFLVVVKQY